MWPWGHLAVGYLLYSGGRRLLGRSAPDDRCALALALGALVPDLVDKPLSWGLGLFPSGYAVGHSALIAFPAGLALLVAGYRRGRGALALAGAFVVGYWSHLAGDVLSGLPYGDGLAFSAVLWPLVEREPYPEQYGLLGRGLHYLREFGAAVGTSDRPVVLLLAAFGPAALALALWLLDGAPGPRALARAGRRLAR